jgi:Cu(I)/Ag(I) efflux system membrane fusion protein
MKNYKIIILLIMIFLAGYLIKGHIFTEHKHQPATAETSQKQVQMWTCAMHPQIRQPKPGKCPICGMDLIPVSQSPAAQRQIEYTEDALKLMEIETTPVERKFVNVQMNMVGKVDYDESRVKEISAWVPGRIDRLYVDFTGIEVNKGDHMVYLYSPQLLSAQAELIQAEKSLQDLKPDVTDLVKSSFIATVEAAREKLRLLGLTKEQIETIEKTGKVTDHLTIYAPTGGIVIAKHANAGDYVETGQKIYTLADLSEVWVKLDAYESDLSWIRYGQKVEFTVEAYPGKVFKGTISFIDPILDSKTRTVKLRVNAENPNDELKPQMFVRAVVYVTPNAEGTVVSPEMAGKWICPMHPNIVKDKPGTCDICGMDLVTAESLGFVTTGANEPPLVIPASAPLITGERAVVYVQVPDVNVPTFEGREVVLGPRAGDYYLVKSGLSEGEMVVTKGNFKIDADLQIHAKPSMMNPEGGAMPPGHMHNHGKMGDAPGSAADKQQQGDPVAEQTLCPVMGEKIDKDIFTEYKGKKIYFCCPACKPKFEKDPEKYISKLPQFKE